MTGKILKVKTGYNPNSSSIGVDMVAFFAIGAGMTVLFNLIATIIDGIQVKQRARPGEDKEVTTQGTTQATTEAKPA
jgi:hypothetical protein